jgi:hypothetical protein
LRYAHPLGCHLAVKSSLKPGDPDAEMNPLCRRMIEDMKIRNLSPQRRYADGLEPCREPCCTAQRFGFERLCYRRSAENKKADMSRITRVGALTRPPAQKGPWP